MKRPDVRQAPRWLLLAVVIGVAALCFGLWFEPEHFYEAYLFAFLFWLGLSLGAMVLSMIAQLTGGRWGRITAASALAASSVMPVLVVLFVPLLFGLEHLYPWLVGAGAEAKLLHHKAPFLNLQFFLVRATIYLAVWLILALQFRKRLLHALTYDRPEDWHRLRRLSAGALVLYALTGTLAAVDWVMSLLPVWYSTMFGAQVLVIQLLSATALMVLALGRMPLPGQTAPEAGDFHDLGNLLLMFVLLWAYFAYSDFLTIWIADLPDETEWYRQRAMTTWQVLGIAVWVLQFFLPFAALLFRALKRRSTALRSLAAAVLLGAALNVYWLVMPSLRQWDTPLHWLDAVAPLTLGALWTLMFLSRSQRVRHAYRERAGGAHVGT